MKIAMTALALDSQPKRYYPYALWLALFTILHNTLDA